MLLRRERIIYFAFRISCCREVTIVTKRINRKRLCGKGNSANVDGILLRIGRNTFPDKKVNLVFHSQE